jgi:signal transduction histidine kinase
MFQKARLKLTAWYLLIIMIISLSFSFILYQMVNLELNRFANSQRNRIERRLSFYQIDNSSKTLLFDQDLIVESRQRFLTNLITINLFIFFSSASLSYFLASRTLRPIQKMTEDQKRFVSDASHELKTPITALKTILEVSLRDPHLDLKEAKTVIKDSITATNQLKKLSDSLLKLDRLSDFSSSLNLEKVKINKIMKASAKSIAFQALAKNITLIVKGVSGEIMADGEKLEELFLIMLDNAIKYSPEGSQIKFIASKNTSFVTFKIIDQGIGISSKDLPHIFDRFYRADNARTKSDASGYGLGLSIARSIIDQHHGSIKVDSLLGQGTTFKLIFPR